MEWALNFGPDVWTLKHLEHPPMEYSPMNLFKPINQSTDKKQKVLGFIVRRNVGSFMSESEFHEQISLAKIFPVRVTYMLQF